ncbi:hypothetical protein JYJ95_02560 [Corallococcus exiguus]|uniref:hypothetical protein n=1 Tax=Corallococcus exiguus TaxID=83462 RepID=UPI001A8F9B93|nr:hypothetical protein [Corallococcus exiguus]MBN8465376.1 hypothetical protein [Corallococcus exiguus]
MQGLKWFVGALALLALACGEVSETSTPVIREGEGLLELPLVSTSAGRSYKLVGATFAITGPQNATITDTSADSVSLALMAGTYSIQMNGEWRVERTDAPGVSVPVTLVSPNPMTFTLGEGESRPVRFLFKVPGDATADVGIGVDSGGWISGSIQFAVRSPPPGSPPDIFAEVVGKSIPFVISFESSTVTRSVDSGEKRVLIETAPVTLQFGGETGTEFQQQFVAPLQGQPMTILITPYTLAGSSHMSSVFVMNNALGVWFDLFIVPMSIGTDADGYALLRPMAFSSGDTELHTHSSNIGGELGSGTFSPQ